ncbi:MAG: hypothetical protein ACOCXQ_03345 [Patescibacteria group bacterium]
MSGISRFISFVIGLIVLILLFVLIANRFSANSDQAARVTPTPTMAPREGEQEGNFFSRLFGGNRAPTATPAPSISPSPTMAPEEEGQINGEFNASPTQAQEETASPTPEPSVTITPTPGEGFNFFGLFRRNTPTPTPSPAPTKTFDEQMSDASQAEDNSEEGQAMNNESSTTEAKLNDVKEIPNTGAPTLLIPLAGIGFAAGMWLRKRAS